MLIDGRCDCFLAFEESTTGTRMFSQENIEGVELGSATTQVMSGKLPI